MKSFRDVEQRQTQRRHCEASSSGVLRLFLLWEMVDILGGTVGSRSCDLCAYMKNRPFVFPNSTLRMTVPASPNFRDFFLA